MKTFTNFNNAECKTIRQIKLNIEKRSSESYFPQKSYQKTHHESRKQNQIKFRTVLEVLPFNPSVSNMRIRSRKARAKKLNNFVYRWKQPQFYFSVELKLVQSRRAHHWKQKQQVQSEMCNRVLS